MKIAITGITTPFPNPRNIAIELLINDATTRTYYVKRQSLWEDSVDDLAGGNNIVLDSEGLLMLFVRHFIKEYLQANPGATLVQIRNNVVGKVVWL